MVFPVVMYGCDIWIIKRLSAEELILSNCGAVENSLIVPWLASRSNKSILKEISPEYSLEGLMLKLKLQYVGHLIPRTDSLEKPVMLGKIEGKMRRGQQRMRYTDSITDLMDMNMSKLWKIVEDGGAWHAEVYDIANSQTRLST